MRPIIDTGYLFHTLAVVLIPIIETRYMYWDQLLISELVLRLNIETGYTLRFVNQENKVLKNIFTLIFIYRYIT